MKVQKPIFIVGVGRSGSTVFHRMLCEHPNVAWLSSQCSRHPNRMSSNKFVMKAIDYPVIGKILIKNLRHGELYDFWEYHCKGFRGPFRDLLPEDVKKNTKEKIQNLMSQTLTKKRSRLLIKITGWPRIGFLHEIFNDAKFIHILRDGRAVTNSMINVKFWHGWSGPNNWRWGQLTPSQNEEWERYDKSFIVLACIQWKILMDAMEKAKRYVNKNDYFEVKYEDLSSHTMNVFKDVVEFCDLEWSRKFEKSIDNYELKNKNYKWKKEFTKDQQKIVENVLHDYLKKYGYI